MLRKFFILSDITATRDLVGGTHFLALNIVSNGQVVHDFTSSAIALKRHFGDNFKLGRVLDTQFALEALQGDIRGSVGSVMEVFAGERDLFSDVAYRYSRRRHYTTGVTFSTILFVRTLDACHEERGSNVSLFVFLLNDTGLLFYPTLSECYYSCFAT